MNYHIVIKIILVVIFIMYFVVSIKGGNNETGETDENTFTGPDGQIIYRSDPESNYPAGSDENGPKYR